MSPYALTTLPTPPAGEEDYGYAITITAPATVVFSFQTNVPWAISLQLEGSADSVAQVSYGPAGLGPGQRNPTVTQTVSLTSQWQTIGFQPQTGNLTLTIALTNAGNAAMLRALQ